MGRYAQSYSKLMAVVREQSVDHVTLTRGAAAPAMATNALAAPFRHEQSPAASAMGGHR